MGGQMIRVMVVEDEFLVRLDVSQQLEDEGFAVLAAATADEALQVLSQEYPVHVLFTDVNMPGQLDGLDLANEAGVHWPQMHVIITSARTFNGAELPANAVFVPKPYDIEALVSTIHTLSNPH